MRKLAADADPEIRAVAVHRPRRAVDLGEQLWSTTPMPNMPRGGRACLGEPVAEGKPQGPRIATWLVAGVLRLLEDARPPVVQALPRRSIEDDAAPQVHRRGAGGQGVWRPRRAVGRLALDRAGALHADDVARPRRRELRRPRRARARAGTKLDTLLACGDKSGRGWPKWARAQLVADAVDEGVGGTPDERAAMLAKLAGRRRSTNSARPRRTARRPWEYRPPDNAEDRERGARR